MEEDRAFADSEKILEDIRYLRRRIPKIENQDWLINFTQLVRRFYAENLGLKGEFSSKEIDEKLKLLDMSENMRDNVKEFNDKLFNMKFAPSKDNTSLYDLSNQFQNIVISLKKEYDEKRKKETIENKKKDKTGRIKRALEERRKRKEQKIVLNARRLIIKAYGFLESGNIKQAAKCYNKLVDLVGKSKEENSNLKREISELYKELTS
ncbi:MAG: hypothetical protein PWR30_352 [Candidatus Woesearchaeota archaeon]|nr:hypothetical protein [Candidatus Woesearchaeota archaeon]